MRRGLQAYTHKALVAALSRPDCAAFFATRAPAGDANNGTITVPADALAASALALGVPRAAVEAISRSTAGPGTRVGWRELRPGALSSCRQASASEPDKS